ncbi:MAG TPA: o-succinylbenzoate synthase [Phycisphaerae bacterium]|nr:o-succinylbenzoate synthase [Phycisphaerae bacterium]
MPRIDVVEIYRVHLPLVYPFRTAYGTDDAVEPVLVKLRSGRFHGWGEAQPFICPTYCPEYSAGVFLLIKNVFAPAIVGHEIDSGDALRQMIACFKGNFFAKGALDMAWWDLFARTRGEPLWKTLGGKGPDIEVGADFGAMERIDALLGKIDQALKAGYKRVKLKYAPGWDLPVIQAVRGAFPDAVFHIDCNSGYTLEDLGMFKQLDRYNLAMIEQPLMYDDLVDHAALQDQICTPICLDESVTSLDKVRKAIEIGACRWINIKPVRVGGHTPALAIHDLCQEAGIGCWVGGMLESGIGAAHCLAAATLSNIKYPCDVFPSSRFFHKDLSVPDWHLSGPSRMTAVDAPGIGCDPDPAMLEACAVEKAVIGQGG